MYGEKADERPPVGEGIIGLFNAIVYAVLEQVVVVVMLAIKYPDVSTRLQVLHVTASG